MDRKSLTNEQANELLDVQAHIWNHIFNFLNSMALKCVIELGIPDAIHEHGQPITLLELARALSIPVPKTEFLNRLMRLLFHSKFFSKKKSPELGDFVFDLTINSQLLLTNHPLSQAPFAFMIFDKIMVDPTNHLSSWLKNDTNIVSPFHISHGRSLWEQTGSMAKFGECFSQAMACDARFVARLMLTTDNESGLFKGVESLVDVGGSNGTMAKAIDDVYPEVKCIVLDLPHMVEGLQGNWFNLVYVGGNMFNVILHAQFVLLKWILHDWSDEDCIKILKRYKEAILSKEKGGRVIIIDMVMKVMDDQNHDTHKFSDYTQILFDMLVMFVTIGGKERTEQDWGKLFFDAGF